MMIAAKTIYDESLARRKGRLNARTAFDFHNGAYLFYGKHRPSSRARPPALFVWLGLHARAMIIIGLDRPRRTWRQYPL